MNIYLAFPQQDGETGVWIENAFLRQGHTVHNYDPKIGRPFTPTEYETASNSDIVLCSRTPTLLPLVQAVRKSEGSTPYLAVWNVDKRNSVTEFGHLMLAFFSNFDCLYTICKGNIEEYGDFMRRLNPTHPPIVKLLQEGAASWTHSPKQVLNLRYACDVMFAGHLNSNVHEGRRELVAALQTLPAEDISLRLYDTYDGSGVFRDEHTKACLASKIVIGHCGWASLELSMSARDYRVMAPGAFLLTEWCPGIEEWFGPPGFCCDYYRTPEECLERIHYWLEHPEDRRAVAKNGSEMVLESHTFDDRVNEIIKDANTWQQGYKDGRS
jgi:hypothetical protein